MQRERDAGRMLSQIGMDGVNKRNACVSIPLSSLSLSLSLFAIKAQESKIVLVVVCSKSRTNLLNSSCSRSFNLIICDYRFNLAYMERISNLPLHSL